MSEVNLDFVERYQEILRKSPKSKVFAPLAEAYRKMGMVSEALQVAQEGVKHHPLLASGRVALGRALAEQNKNDEALAEFERAVEISPENILAHSCLGKMRLRLRQPKKALQAYKMVLFLNPLDEEARKVIAKLESLTADEYQEEVFAMVDLKSIFRRKTTAESDAKKASKDDTPPSSGPPKGLLRALSLTDAFIIRNEIDRAARVLKAAYKEFGPSPEIRARSEMINERMENLEEQVTEEEIAEPIKPLSHQQLRKDQKREKLQRLLNRVAAHKDSPEPT